MLYRVAFWIEVKLWNNAARNLRGMNQLEAMPKTKWVDNGPFDG